MKKTKLRKPTGIVFTNSDFEIWNNLQRSASYFMGIAGMALLLAFGIYKVADYAMDENSEYVVDYDNSCHGVKDVYDMVHESIEKNPK